MLTGDNERTAKAVASKLGIDRVIAQVFPQQKEQVISVKRRRRKENVWQWWVMELMMHQH